MDRHDVLARAVCKEFADPDLIYSFLVFFEPALLLQTICALVFAFGTSGRMSRLDGGLLVMAFFKCHQVIHGHS